MPKARSEVISLETTPYYHVVTRCVRQSFLCGKNLVTGKSFEHRRAWIENRLLFLSTVFTIDLCAYSIMHNHYHITVHINTSKASTLSDREVVERWHKIYKGTDLSQRYLAGYSLTNSEHQVIKSTCEIWRARLCNISWYMRCTNEPISRRANKEDGCTGHFWDGRFKSIPILDFRALMATMVYNDLNPIKAGIAADVASSEYTSIAKRTKHQHANQKISQGMTAFADEPHHADAHVLPFQLSEYQQAVEWTALNYYSTKTEPTKCSAPNLVNSLGLLNDQWADAVTNFESNFSSIIGTQRNVRQFCQRLNKRWMHGIANCKRCFDTIGQEYKPLKSKMLAAPPNIQT